MIKQIIISFLVLISISAKAQDTIKIPVPAARQIAKDLTICDSIKAVHELIKDQLILTENKTLIKDSVIESYKMKCSLYDTIINNEQKKFEIQKSWSESLRKDNKSLKARLLYTKITLGTIIIFLGYLLIKVT